MSRVFKWGSYVWTASSAGWFVLAFVTGVPEAWFVCLGCALLAYSWSGMKGGGDTPEGGNR